MLTFRTVVLFFVGPYGRSVVMMAHDIISRLLAAAEYAPAEIGALLEEAALDIEALKTLVSVREQMDSVREEIDLETAKPAGRA
jgi:hypothetical protein